MKLRKKQGKIIFMPLDTLFTMSELFGSTQQKYDAVTGEYIVDRTMAPFTLKPNFSVTDKEGRLSGDHTAELVNCVWTVSARVNNAAPIRNTHYTINDTIHAITLVFYLDPDTTGFVRFTADYIDPRRGDVLKVFWEKPLSCISATDWKVTLGTEWQMRTNLIPWKDRGIFTIPVQLRNGSTDIADADSVYQWEIFEVVNNVGSWRSINPQRDIWCRGGEQTKQISIEQKYVQRILIRCKAWPVGETSYLQVQSFLLRRFYGLYDDDLEILEGAYIFPETSRAVAEAYVTNRSGGRIVNPEQYFDIEILYSRGDGNWWHVAHGTRGEVPRSMFPVDSTMEHLFAEITREKTALIPFTLDGAYLTLDGAVLVGQHPIIERDIEE
jgi:hypothetical protein